MAQRVAIITGTNRGIGKRTAEILLEKYSSGFHYIFTQRAANHSELTASLRKVNPQASFEIQSLELTNKRSRDQFLNIVTKQHKSVDVILNNAGFWNPVDTGKSRPTRDVAEATLDVNFKSTVDFTEEIYPSLSNDGRIIQISSRMGGTRHQPKAAQELISDPNITKERLFQICNEFIQKTDDPNADLIFHNQVYRISKALLTTYVRFVATKYIKPDQSIFAVHPGWVQTDMGGAQAELSVNDACPYLAELVAGIPFKRHELSGRLIYKNKPMEF